MTERTLDLTQRLDRLERENRRLKRIGGTVLLGLLSLLLMGQVAPRFVTPVINSKQFLLVDDNGDPRAMLGVGAGRSILTLLRQDGGHAWFFLQDDGLASLQLGGISTPSVTMTAPPDGLPSIVLRAKDGKVIWKAP